MEWNKIICEERLGNIEHGVQFLDGGIRSEHKDTNSREGQNCLILVIREILELVI